MPVEANSPDEADLLSLMDEHIERTGSEKAKRLRADWVNARPRFVMVAPVKS